jgi:chemotaxis protein MotB
MKIRRSLNIYLTSSLIISLVLSCVTPRKYDRALNEIARLRVDSTVLVNKVFDERYQRTDTLLEIQADLRKKAAKLDSISMWIRQRANYLDQLENNLGKELNDLVGGYLDTRQEDGNIYLTLDNKILFNTGSDDISGSGKAILKRLGNALNETDNEILVVGHTDNQPYVGEQMDNWDLSTMRALSVTRTLIGAGVSPDQLIAAGRASFNPVTGNNTDVGRLLNRRVEIIIHPNLYKIESYFKEVLPEL